MKTKRRTPKAGHVWKNFRLENLKERPLAEQGWYRKSPEATKYVNGVRV